MICKDFRIYLSWWQSDRNRLQNMSDIDKMDNFRQFTDFDDN